MNKFGLKSKTVSWSPLTAEKLVLSENSSVLNGLTCLGAFQNFLLS